jgi:sigma-B regulation protein RsbU (phosphoserine phosphatase)
MDPGKVAFVPARRGTVEGAETGLQAGLRHIVESIYGPAAPPLAGLDIGRSYRSAAHDFVYGGDLVDVFHYGGGLTSVAVVDITGHGIAAAMNAGLVKHALRAYASHGLDALATVRSLNRLCIENSIFEAADDFFATVFYGIIDREHRAFEYVSAGHDAAYLIRDGGIALLGASGPVVGLLDDGEAFAGRVVALHDGDVIAVATDGFTEARNAARLFLGPDALATVARAESILGAQVGAEAITQFAYDYAGRQLHDDIAALVVKITAGESEPTSVART